MYSIVMVIDWDGYPILWKEKWFKPRDDGHKEKGVIIHLVLVVCYKDREMSRVIVQLTRVME